ncbi:GDSL-type esterase/lipase family protein [Erwiniaceae bacterium BAC15a-03b]|uniref:GDSL-type esterase/lipase family protein n=1 Tax=Winslowiella arboricola TaxID=2978220 RepID=A0A9J6PY71_9GAMM|nr:GDSL-type esterase/lipase family protein [Winslowiella arboricola]MCU5775138.1 GDSL-type esterase/lipase family protein [Winslowiella arboricola]MCU5780408.1 GDSL-type esterase/lipase family protein [Winslowiella arboricola]
MALSDTTQAKKYASVAEVAAAQAKEAVVEALKAPVYADEAKQYAEQALQSSSEAGEYSTQAGISVALSSENANIAKESAESAASSAKNAQNMADAKTYYITESDPTGTIAGLAGTQSGDGFRVAQGVDSNESFRYYVNDNGEAVEKASQVGTALVEATKILANDVDRRTNGVQSQKKSKYPFEILDGKGKVALYIDNTGKLNSPGGAYLATLDISVLNSPELVTNLATIQKLVTNLSLAIGLNVFSPKKNSRYAYSVTDTNGRVSQGVLLDGTMEYMGLPLSQQIGQIKNDFFFIGDSITAFTETTSNDYNSTNRDQAPAVCAQGWPVWGEMLSQGRILKTGISATGGFRADQILATHVPVAVAAKPKFCVVLAGRNNIVQIDSYTYEQTIKSMASIYLTLRKAGITPVCCSMSAQSGNTDAQNTMRYKLNEWIRAYAEKYSLPFVDMHKATTDPLTGEWYSGWNYDASHPTAIGAKAMGQALVDVMSLWVGGTSPRMAESNTTPATSTNLITNPLFITTSATNVPESWDVGTAGVVTLESNAAVKGSVLHLVSANGTNQASRSQTIAVTPGDVMEFSMKFKAGTETVNNAWVHYAATPFAGGNILAGIRLWKAVTDFGTYSQRFTVPAGVTSVFVSLSGFDLSIGQIGLFKITGI